MPRGPRGPGGPLRVVSSRREPYLAEERGSDRTEAKGRKSKSLRKWWEEHDVKYRWFIYIRFLSILLIDIFLNRRTFLLQLLKLYIFQIKFILLFKILFSFHVLQIVNKTMVVFNLLLIWIRTSLLSGLLHSINVKHRRKSFHILGSMLFIHWKLTDLIIIFFCMLYHSTWSNASFLFGLMFLTVCYTLCYLVCLIEDFAF